MVCNPTFSFTHQMAPNANRNLMTIKAENKLPSPTSTATLMSEDRDRMRQVTFSCETSAHAIYSIPKSSSPSSGLSSSISQSSSSFDERKASSESLDASATRSIGRKRRFDELTICNPFNYDCEEEAVEAPAKKASCEDPLQAEALALWQQWPRSSQSLCTFCNSCRHDCHGCAHLIQRISSLGRYARDLARSDLRRARGWFALYLRNVRDVTKLICISEVLYRRACQQGVWQPILQTKMTWPCTEEYAVQEFMIVCTSYPTLWMSPSELLMAKKALRQETIQFYSPTNSLSSTPRCSPTLYLDDDQDSLE